MTITATGNAEYNTYVSIVWLEKWRVASEEIRGHLHITSLYNNYIVICITHKRNACPAPNLRWETDYLERVGEILGIYYHLGVA